METGSRQIVRVANVVKECCGNQQIRVNPRQEANVLGRIGHASNVVPTTGHCLRKQSPGEIARCVWCHHGTSVGRLK
jgi:hypothetical protein